MLEQENAIFPERPVPNSAGMMKLFPLFGRLAALRRFAGHADPGDLAWETDPLSHPALRRMTPDQLADLPIGRGRHSGEEGGPLSGAGAGRLPETGQVIPFRPRRGPAVTGPSGAARDRASC